MGTVKGRGGPPVRARLLIVADGATSRVATALGHVTDPPAGICSRAYIEGGHRAEFDGVCFYRRESLPGYCALFKVREREGGGRRCVRDPPRKTDNPPFPLPLFQHVNNELGYCYYLIPCGPRGACGAVAEADLPRLHADALKNDPFLAAAVGPKAKVGRMRAAPLRLGGQGVKRSSAAHLVREERKEGGGGRRRGGGRRFF